MLQNVSYNPLILAIEMSSESEPDELEDLDDLNDIKHSDDCLDDLDKVIIDVNSTFNYIFRGA